MKKSEFNKEVQELLEGLEIKVNQTKATEISDGIFDLIKGLVAEGEEVPVGVLGKFTSAERNARKGYNPKLLQELKAQGVSEEEAKKQAQIEIEAKRVPAFKPSKAFKDELKK